MDPAQPAEIEHMFLIINGMKIDFGEDTFSLKPDQLRFEERYQILSPTYRKLGHEIAQVNELIREDPQAKFECLLANMFQLLHSHTL